MKKRYRSKGDQVDLYLVMQEAAVQVLDDQILIFGSEEVEQIIQQSIDLYHQLGQPRLSDYYLMFQEQQVVISVGNRRFHFPSF